MIRVACSARLTGIVTDIKTLGARVWGLCGEIIRRLNAVRADGVERFAHSYAYEASVTAPTAARVPA